MGAAAAATTATVSSAADTADAAGDQQGTALRRSMRKRTQPGEKATLPSSKQVVTASGVGRAAKEVDECTPIVLCVCSGLLRVGLFLVQLQGTRANGPVLVCALFTSLPRVLIYS